MARAEQKPPWVFQNYFPSAVKWSRTKMTKTVKNMKILFCFSISSKYQCISPT